MPPLPPSLRHLVILHLAKLSPTPALRGATSTTLGALLTLHLDSRDPTVGTPSPSRAGTRDSRRDSLSLLGPGLPVPPAPGLAAGLSSPCSRSGLAAGLSLSLLASGLAAGLSLSLLASGLAAGLSLSLLASGLAAGLSLSLLASGLAAGLSLSLLASGLAAGLSLSLLASGLAAGLSSLPARARDSRRDSPCPSRAGTRDGTSRRESLAIPMSEKDVGVPMTCGSPDDVLESR